MERQDIAYLVNSTPKYYYLLPLHFQLVRRYAPNLKWPLYIATEEPNHPIIQEVSTKYQVNILPLDLKDRYFLESRVAGTDALPSHIQYVFPIQEDFLLENRIDEEGLSNSLKIFDDDPDVLSIRIMPCPGPPTNPRRPYEVAPFLHANAQPMIFTYQATLFRRETYSLFMTALIEFPLPVLAQILNTTHIPDSQLNEEQIAERKKNIQIKYNIAEQNPGQNKFRELFGNKKHLGWPRAHMYANAVYLCPWPYRPTAVERGTLQPWVYEFAEREGFPLPK